MLKTLRLGILGAVVAGTVATATPAVASSETSSSYGWGGSTPVILTATTEVDGVTEETTVRIFGRLWIRSHSTTGGAADFDLGFLSGSESAGIQDGITSQGLIDENEKKMMIKMTCGDLPYTFWSLEAGDIQMRYASCDYALPEGPTNFASIVESIMAVTE